MTKKIQRQKILSDLAFKMCVLDYRKKRNERQSTFRLNRDKKEISIFTFEIRPENRLGSRKPTKKRNENVSKRFIFHKKKQKKKFQGLLRNFVQKPVWRS
jgi:hypothetical protein